MLFICKESGRHDKHGPNCLRPVEFCSGQFNAAQLNYYMPEKELFAGKEGMKKWAHFLLGRTFTWHIDNAVLKWAHKNRSTKLRLSQWLAEISEFQAQIVLKPSAQMKVTDCLSRQFAEINAIRLTKPEIRQLQDLDPTLKAARTHASNNRWPIRPGEPLLSYKKLRKNLIFGSSGELLVKKGGVTMLAVPTSIVTDIIKTYHDDVGHPGAEKTVADVSKSYFWPSLKIDVTSFIASCHDCQISRPNLRPKQAPLGLSETPERPYEVIAFDLIGPLPATNKEHKFALVGFDLFSKRIYADPLTSKAPEKIRSCVERIVFGNPIMPKTILTDNGSEFSQISGFCENFGIRHSTSPSYHPQTNGAVERMNQTLKQRLFETGGEHTWDARLQRTLHAINGSPNQVTKMSPFLVETGFSGKNAFDRVEHATPNPGNLNQLHQEALKRIRSEKTARVEKGKKSNFRPYEVGQLVLAKNHQNKMPRFVGPFEVIKVKGGGLSYDLKAFDSARNFTRAASDLKPYNPRDPSKYPSHLAPQDSSDSETSLEDQQTPFDNVFEPPRGSPDDPGQMGQKPENPKIGHRSNRSHFAPGHGTETPDSAFESTQNQNFGAKISGPGMVTEKNSNTFHAKSCFFSDQEIFSKNRPHSVPWDISRDTHGTSGKAHGGLPLPGFSRPSAPPSGHGGPITAEKPKFSKIFFEAGHSAHASRSAHGPYVIAPGDSVPASPADHVAAGHAARNNPPGVSQALDGAASGPPIFDIFNDEDFPSLFNENRGQDGVLQPPYCRTHPPTPPSSSVESVATVTSCSETDGASSCSETAEARDPVAAVSIDDDRSVLTTPVSSAPTSGTSDTADDSSSSETSERSFVTVARRGSSSSSASSNVTSRSVVSMETDEWPADPINTFVRLIPPPPSTSLAKIPLYRLNRPNLDDILERCGLSVNCNREQAKKRIDNWFQRHKPDHPRTNQGSLIFPVYLKAEKPFLRDYGLAELVIIAQSYEISEAIAQSSQPRRDVLYNLTRQFFMQKYPGLQKTQDGDLIFDTPKTDTSNCNSQEPTQQTFSF